MSDENTPQQRIINIDQAETMDWGKGNQYAAKMGPLAPAVGATKLGFNVTRLAPGKAAFPYHFHHNTEELFIVVEGSGTVRSADGEHPLRQGDLLLCPTGPDGGHKIVNDSDADLVYLAVSNKPSMDVVEYPDSNKCAAMVGSPWTGMAFRKVFPQDADVDYWEGEETD
jgi:uncharacterized cupin superfamily protein